MNNKEYMTQILFCAAAIIFAFIVVLTIGGNYSG